MIPLRCEWSGGVSAFPQPGLLWVIRSAVLISQAQLRDRCLLPLRLALARGV
jgi:hypothetical protein